MKHVVHKESQAMKTDDLICLWMRMSLFALFLLVMCVAFADKEGTISVSASDWASGKVG